MGTRYGHSCLPLTLPAQGRHPQPPCHFVRCPLQGSQADELSITQGEELEVIEDGDAEEWVKVGAGSAPPPCWGDTFWRSPGLSPPWGLRWSHAFCPFRHRTRQVRSAMSPKSTYCPWAVSWGLGLAPQDPLPCTASSLTSWLQNWSWSPEVGAGVSPPLRRGQMHRAGAWGMLSPCSSSTGGAEPSPHPPRSLAGASPV